LSDLLDRYRPLPGTDDQREFAWYYTRQFSREAPGAILPADSKRVTRAVFSADGRRLVSAGWDEVVRVWELPRGFCRQAIKLMKGPNALSPDGQTLVVIPAEARRAVQFVDLATGKSRALLKDACTSEIQHLRISPDGKTLAAISGEEVYLWDMHSLGPCGYCREEAATDHLELALSSGARTLATVARRDSTLVRLRDVAGGAIRAELRFDASVSDLLYAPREELLAVRLQNGRVSLIYTDGDRLDEWQSIGRQNDGLVAFSPDGRWLASGQREEVWLWDLRDRAFRNRFRWQNRSITALAFSPDGQVLAAGTDDGLLHRVNPYCPPAHETLLANLRPFGPMAVTHDGKTLALLDQDGTVKLVDAASGKVRLTLKGHSGSIADCAFAPDDRTLATVDTFDTQVRLWDSTTGRETRRFPAGAAAIRRLAFSPRGGLLAGGEEGSAVWIWDLASGQTRGRLPGHEPSVREVAFSADGRVLVSCDGSPLVRLWDVSPGGSLPNVPREKVALPGSVNAIAFAPMGRTLAIGYEDLVQFREVPDVGSSRPVGSPLAPGKGAAVTYVAFSPNGQSLLASRNDTAWYSSSRVVVCDVKSRSLSLSLGGLGLSAEPHAVAWMPDGCVVALSVARRVQIYDLARVSVRVLPDQTLWDVASLAFSPDGRSLYLGTADCLGDMRSYGVALVPYDRPIPMDHKYKANVADSVRVWDLDRFTAGPPLPGEECQVLPSLVALSADGRLLAAGGPDGSIRLWDLACRRPLARLFISERARSYANGIETFFAVLPGKPEYFEKSEGVRSLAFSPDCRWLAAAGERGTVTLWNTEGWQEHHAVPATQEGTGWLGFSPDSTLALACKGEVRFFDPSTGQARAALGAESDSPILCGAFAPGGRLLATGAAEGAIRVWDLATRKQTRLAGHMNQVAAVAFSPDGKTLASGDQSGEVKLWSVATLQEVGSQDGHGGQIHCLAFSPDGQTLAAGAEMGLGIGEVFLWRAPRREP
jgi:WD40 repeat protein